MVVDNAAHVRHATVAYFHVVLVKDGVQIVIWWEVFLDQVEEGFSYVGLLLYRGLNRRFVFYFFFSQEKFSCSNEGLY